MSVYALTNMATGHSFEITVPVGADVTGIARAFLAHHDVPPEAQEGFFVSVFPSDLARLPTHAATDYLDGPEATRSGDLGHS